MQKIRKKKRKILHGMFSHTVFLFLVIKRAEKVSGFVFFRKGRGKMQNKLLKKKKKNVFSFRELIRKCFGVKEKE